MRVADYIFQTLADYGVEHVFFVSGGGAMFLNDALGREKRIRHICTHHEQAAAIAAEGYARVTNRLSVVSVTTGPGGTNAMTGLIGAWLDSIPVLFISGQVKFPTTIASRPHLPLRQLGDQEINIVDIVKPVTKYAAMVTDPTAIRSELEKAIHLATTGRKGPVWLDIPINVQSAEIHSDQLKPYSETSIAVPEIPEDLVIKIMSLIKQSKAPVIVAGHGIRLSGAEKEFRQLAQQLQIPVLGTFGGFDLLPTDSPYSIGRTGTIGTRDGNIALQNADLILCLGTRNNVRQASYNYENFGRNAQSIVVVDIDKAELEKDTVRITHPIHADVRDFILKLSQLLTKNSYSGSTHHQSWLHWNQDRKRRYSAVLPEYANVTEGVQPYYFGEKLTEALDEDAIVACTNATPSLALFQAGIVKSGQRMFANSGCAAMGYGLPASLGAALAAYKSERQIICLEGDGSLMMNVQELQTIAHQDLPIKLFLFNNGEYASIRQTHDNFFALRTGCDGESGVTFPEWEKVADAFNWPYVCIESQTRLEEQIQTVLQHPGRVFCNVVLTLNYTFMPKLSSRRLPDGSIVSPSLEDMFPFLSEEEMRGNYYHAD